MKEKVITIRLSKDMFDKLKNKVDEEPDVYPSVSYVIRRLIHENLR